MDKVDYLEKLPVKVLKVKHSVTGEIHDVLVDGDYDGEYLSGLKWRILPSGYVMSYGGSQRLDEATGKPIGVYEHDQFYLHQLVLPPRKGYWTRFRNGNKLDCRSANLEYMTPSTSAATRRAPKDKTTYGKAKEGISYRGVQRLTTGAKKGQPRYISQTRFVAYCRGKYLGSFGTPEEAARAYDKAALENWGDRAILNFPKEEKWEGSILRKIRRAPQLRSVSMKK